MRQKSRAIQVLTWLLENIAPLQRSDKFESSTANYLRRALWVMVAERVAPGESILFEDGNWVIEEGRIQRTIHQRFQSHGIPPLPRHWQKSTIISYRDNGRKVLLRCRYGGLAARRQRGGLPPQTIILHLVALTYAATTAEAATTIVKGVGGRSSNSAADDVE
jgi:hypothetical protein